MHANSTATPDISIVSTSGSDVVLNGIIDNPLGQIEMISAGGIIGSGILRANSIVLDAQNGRIGTSTAERVNVDLVRSAGLPTSFTATAESDVFLRLSGRMREDNVSQATFDIDEVSSATGSVDVLLQPSRLEVDPLDGFVGGLLVTVVKEPTNGFFYERFRPDVPEEDRTPLDPRIFPDLTKATNIESTYDFAKTQAAGSITIAAFFPATTDPRINIEASTDVDSDVNNSGAVYVLTNGDIRVTETAGSLRVV